VLRVTTRPLADLLADCWLRGGTPNMLRMGPVQTRLYRRWIQSGALATVAKRNHARATKGARRRNRGRGTFARCR